MNWQVMVLASRSLKLKLKQRTSVHTPAPGCCWGDESFQTSLPVLCCKCSQWPDVRFYQLWWFSWKWGLNMLCLWGPAVRGTVLQCIPSAGGLCQKNSPPLLPGILFLKLPSLWTENNFWSSELLQWPASCHGLLLRSPWSPVMRWMLVQVSYDTNTNSSVTITYITEI